MTVDYEPGRADAKIERFDARAVGHGVARSDEEGDAVSSKLWRGTRRRFAREAGRSLVTDSAERGRVTAESRRPRENDGRIDSSANGDSKSGRLDHE